MSDRQPRGSPDVWARFRFSIIGKLFASPPQWGELHRELEALARQRYRHPTKPGQWVTFGVSTLERWYYQALGADDPIAKLRRKIRSDARQSKAMSPELLSVLQEQYQEHRKWSYQLHRDNLAALVEEQPVLGPAPSYSTVYRRMQQRGWLKLRGRKARTKGQQAAVERLEKREVRSYEATHVQGL